MMMTTTHPLARNQAVRFRDSLVHIQTVIFNEIECLCLEDVQQRFPSVSAFSIDNVQVAFLRDHQGNYLSPLRIKVAKNYTVDALEPIGKSTDAVSALFDQLGAKIQQMDKKTDLILANTQETLMRIKNVMTQMYELHEYTTPRFFLILPTKHHQWNSLNTVQNWFLLQYKLYFFCECSSEPNQLHLAPHDGYLIKKPSEFIANYGSYLRTTLNIARSVLSVGGFVVPQAQNLSTVVGSTLPPFAKEAGNYAEIDNKLDLVERMLTQIDHDLVQVDSSTVRKVVLPNIPLQGAQLRELDAFLENVDSTHSLGNLYRTTTDDGHVRWVCLEHYNAMGFTSKLTEYIRQCQAMGGEYDSSTKELVLTGHLTTKNINMICDALTKGFTVLSLVLRHCSLDMADSDKLFDTVINRSSIHRFVLAAVELSKWTRMSKCTCDHLIVYLKNQSLKVQYNRNALGDATEVLVRFLRQNKICRSLDLFGYDLAMEDQELLAYLKSNVEITSLVIHHSVHEQFLREIFKNNNSSLSRLKLRFSLTSSSNVLNLYQALETNKTLVDLDMMDQTFANDGRSLIDLFKIIQRHRSIKCLHLHVFDVQPSQPKETCLITALLHDGFISHLRISDSVISHQFTEALVHACQEGHSLTHLELYNCELDDDDLSSLQLSHASENLTHLLISDQFYWSGTLAEMRQQLVNGKGSDRCFVRHSALSRSTRISTASKRVTGSEDRSGLSSLNCVSR